MKKALRLLYRTYLLLRVFFLPSTHAGLTILVFLYGLAVFGLSLLGACIFSRTWHPGVGATVTFYIGAFVVLLIFYSIPKDLPRLRDYWLSTKRRAFDKYPLDSTEELWDDMEETYDAGYRSAGSSILMRPPPTFRQPPPQTPIPPERPSPSASPAPIPNVTFHPHPSSSITTASPPLDDSITVPMFATALQSLLVERLE